MDSSGKGQAAAFFNQGGAGNDAAHPAKAGDSLLLYATGTGQTNPPGADGAIGAIPLPLVSLLPVTATIGGKDATVQYAGGAFGIVAGVTQINLLVPAGLPAGPVPVMVQVGTFSTQGNVTIVASGN